MYDKAGRICIHPDIVALECEILQNMAFRVHFVTRFDRACEAYGVTPLIKKLVKYSHSRFRDDSTALEWIRNQLEDRVSFYTIPTPSSDTHDQVSTKPHPVDTTSRKRKNASTLPLSISYVKRRNTYRAPSSEGDFLQDILSDLDACCQYVDQLDHTCSNFEFDATWHMQCVSCNVVRA